MRMFRINDDLSIEHTKGDSAAIKITLNREGTLGSNDRVVFAIKSAYGDDVLRKVVTPSSNVVWFSLNNQDTDSIPAGDYLWDIRVVTGAIVGSDGFPTGGTVTTPMTMKPYKLLEVAGDI